MLIKNNIEIVKTIIASASKKPGVYKFINSINQIIYVGKACNIPDRLRSYLNISTIKIQRIVEEMADLEIIYTETETEALLLESQLIKEYKPHYNILLKDDKTFPYIVLDKIHKFSRLLKYRGSDMQNKIYYGPFPSNYELEKAVGVLQRLFLIRTCNDKFFESRKTPCILYQIKHCSAPCVNKISLDQYQDLENQMKVFVEKGNLGLSKELIRQMEEASEKMQYEKAALYRDRIKILSKLTIKQAIDSQRIHEADFICGMPWGDQLEISITFVRSGNILGTKMLAIKMSAVDEISEVMAACISKFYISNLVPNVIVLDSEIEAADKKILQDALQSKYGKEVSIILPKGKYRTMMDECRRVLKARISKQFEDSQKHHYYFDRVAELFSLKKLNKIEVYDNSHLSGAHAVGAKIVCERQGFNKKLYKLYSVSNKIGDDYQMLREVIDRRLSDQNSGYPELIIVDGGLGHLEVVKKLLNDHGISGIEVISMAKGKERNSGNELLYRADGAELYLKKNDRLKHYLQILRDEAHSFAISGCRKKSLAILEKSQLDLIPGVGTKRKRQLLVHFGSLEGVSRASQEELSKIPGIDIRIAAMVYKYLHKN